MEVAKLRQAVRTGKDEQRRDVSVRHDVVVLHIPVLPACSRHVRVIARTPQSSETGCMPCTATREHGIATARQASSSSYYGNEEQQHSSTAAQESTVAMHTACLQAISRSARHVARLKHVQGEVSHHKRVGDGRVDGKVEQLPGTLEVLHGVCGAVQAIIPSEASKQPRIISTVVVVVVYYKCYRHRSVQE